MKLLIATMTILSALAPATVHIQDTPSINGKWTISGEVMGHSDEVICTFQQQDKVLKGECGDYGEIKEGSVSDDTYTWSTEGGRTPLKYTAKIIEGELKGTIDAPAYSAQGEFHGTQVK